MFAPAYMGGKRWAQPSDRFSYPTRDCWRLLRRRLVEDNMSAAPMALGFMMGIPTQPFRAGLTFSGRPPGSGPGLQRV
jgi:hypothetical protein